MRTWSAEKKNSEVACGVTAWHCCEGASAWGVSFMVRCVCGVALACLPTKRPQGPHSREVGFQEGRPWPAMHQEGGLTRILGRWLPLTASAATTRPGPEGETGVMAHMAARRVPVALRSGVTTAHSVDRRLRAPRPPKPSARAGRGMETAAEAPTERRGPLAVVLGAGATCCAMILPRKLCAWSIPNENSEGGGRP